MESHVDVPEQLFESVFATGELWTRKALMAPDGRFLMLKGKSEYDALRKIHVVLNWAEELRRGR